MNPPIAAKSFYQSTTFWINFLGIVAVVLKLTVSSNLIPDADVTTILVSLLNIVNRLRPPQTVQPLKF
jgi:hypothetical protein